MFEKFDPVKGDILQVMDCDGKIVNAEHMPKLSDEKVVAAYKMMLYARMVDVKAVSYQRQGRMYTYPPCLGQEAVAVGTGMLLEKEDWLVPAYREVGTYLCKGATAKDIYLFWGGYEDGCRFPGASNMLPISVPIASQLLHAAGIGYGLKYQKKGGIVFTYIGDGGTSEGDFHEALNYASVWKVPVAFVCQNNQYAISMPRAKQTASTNIAIKSLAYGMPGIMVDGNDFFACYAVSKMVADHLRSGGMPVLIEFITYRQGAHTTSDDPSRYRSKEEEQEWAKKDPLKRLRTYLEKKKLWSEKQEKETEEEYETDIDGQFSQYEQHSYQLDDVFRYMYVEMPDDLKKQKEEYEQYLQWKEAR